MPAQSSGVETRPSRMSSLNSAIASPAFEVRPVCMICSSRLRHSSVATIPGQNPLTVIWFGGKLAGRGLGQSDHGELGGAVGADERESLLAGDRGGVDYLAAGALAEELLGCFLDADENAEAVDPHQAFPLCPGGVHDGYRLGHAGVVEHHVERPETVAAA